MVLAVQLRQRLFPVGDPAAILHWWGALDAMDVRALGPMNNTGLITSVELRNDAARLVLFIFSSIRDARSQIVWGLALRARLVRGVAVHENISL